jgi:uncharacterized protein (DUF1800 family)
LIQGDDPFVIVMLLKCKTPIEGFPTSMRYAEVSVKKRSLQMTPMTIAAQRFGYGMKTAGQNMSDVKSALKDQLRRYAPVHPALANVATRAVVAGELAEFYAERREVRMEAGEQGAGQSQTPEKKQMRQEVGLLGREHYQTAVGARFNAAVQSDTPFVERLVHFWANHFAVSANKLGVIGLSGLMEFDAIRPHVLGRFSDMMIAVEQHPAMLMYLDQVQSIGPNSPLGKRFANRNPENTQRGLNENLAREILELHTLGVRNGYGQTDVTEFARALTGWTIGGMARGRLIGRAEADRTETVKPGDFQFRPGMHEPGARTIMGKSFPENGVGQGLSILNMLANHPATARHIATKLARHFAGDTPPPALVDRLARRFTETQGDLRAVSMALIDAPEVWAAKPLKFKTPWDWTVSAYRALNLPTPPAQLVANALAQLGQPVWRPNSPAGYDDVMASWAAPDAVYRRVELASRMVIGAKITNPSAFAKDMFGSGLSPATATAIERAESPQQGLALLLVSPEFLRR